MEVVPEAIIIMGAGVTAFIVGGLKSAFAGINDRTAALTAGTVGVVVAGLVYAGGFVETGEMSTVQIAARAVIAGVTMGAAASGGRSWTTGLRGTGSGQ